jgi:hypothetical protein
VSRQLRHGDNTDREPIPEIARYRRSAKLMPMPNMPSTRPLRILVVGAGVGGISIARAYCATDMTSQSSNGARM